MLAKDIFARCMEISLTVALQHAAQHNKVAVYALAGGSASFRALLEQP